jgi:hypothetical protein
MIHCPLKNTGSQILCIMQIACPVIDVVENTIHIPLIKLTEGIMVSLRGERKDFLFVEVELLHAVFLPAGSLTITPADFRSYTRV